MKLLKFLQYSLKNKEYSLKILLTEGKQKQNTTIKVGRGN